MARSVHPYEVIEAPETPDVVLESARAALRDRGITEYAVIDHGADMARAGAPGHVAWTLVFGNPAAGAKLLSRDPAAAVDIPLRLAVVGAAGGDTEIVIRDMRTLIGDIDADLAEAFNEVVRSIAVEAAR